MITINAWISEPHESGYKYLISQDGTSWSAYKTDKGFKQFLLVTGLEIDETKTKTINGGYVSRYNKGKRIVDRIWKDDLVVVTMVCEPRKIDEVYFWRFDELPQNSKSFMGLCNGSYVSCYYFQEDNQTTIYRPNPNATKENKERYKTQEEYEAAVNRRIYYPNSSEFDAVYIPLSIEKHIAYAKENG